MFYVVVVADCFERVHRVGPSVHPRLPLQLLASRQQGSAEHLRADHPEATARQRRRRPVSRQSSHEIHGGERESRTKLLNFDTFMNREWSLVSDSVNKARTQMQRLLKKHEF